MLFIKYIMAYGKKKGIKKYGRKNKKLANTIRRLSSHDIQLFAGENAASVGGNAANFSGGFSIISLETDLLGLIRNGTAESNRIGNEILVHDVDVCLVCTLADSTQIVRFCMYHCELSTSMLTPMATSGFTINTVLSKKWGYGTNIRRIFCDDMFVLGTDFKTTMVWKKKIYFKTPLRVRYYTDANNANNTKLYLLAVSDSGAVSHPTCPLVQYKIYFENA